jgi:broad specificity phosphatase PhoE
MINKVMSNLQDTHCRLYIVRHGESEGNVLGLIQGHTDFPLTTRGKEQAMTLARSLREVEFAEVFSSDLSRARETAAVVASERKLIVKTNQLLRERHFGKYEKDATVESQRELIELLKIHENVVDKDRFKQKVASDIESDEEVVSRFLLFLREVAVAYQNKNVLVVSHSGMLRGLLVHLGAFIYADMPHVKVPNASYIVLDSDGVDFYVRELVGISRVSQNQKTII